jgi:hypothetical protein
MNNIFGEMFMKVQSGMCMLSPCGIAVKTSAGYRSYNVKTGKLRNCDNLVFSFGDGMFFVIPTVKVKPGDIILNGGRPACVRKASAGSIEVINYETSVVETILPERHVFMGNTYFYGKIVSLFGDGASICGKGSVTRMMKFMMLGSLMGNGTGTRSGALAPQDGMGPQGNMGMLLPLMLMKGDGFDDLFRGLFDGEQEDEAETDDGDDEDDLF